MDESNPTVLLVDDDPALLRLLKLVLRTDGFRICTAIHGLDALDHLDSCAPDLIVLDMEMPVMDGPTFLRRIREQGCRTPVLVLSACDSARSRLFGAEGFLSKPFVPEELSAKIRCLVAA